MLQCSDCRPRDVNEVHIFRHTLSEAALNQTLVQYNYVKCALKDFSTPGVVLVTSNSKRVPVLYLVLHSK